MIKTRSNIRLSRGWLLFALILAASVPGCKKKALPPPPQVTPLPKKQQQAPGAVSQVPAAVPVPAVQAKVSSAKKPVVALPVQKQQSSAARSLPHGAVILDFTNRRDPFRPFAQAPAAQQPGGSKVAKSRVRDPLPIQIHDTEKFRITGIITGLKENSALVIDPVGKGYVIKEGMLIGNNEGRVKRVTPSAVEVEETSRDDAGKVRKRVITLRLLRKK
jgi:type IV pilus assembly protein PilP